MTMLTPRRITLGFYAAALTNIVGVLIVSRAYSNELLGALSPSVFSTFGVVCIQLWGLAYLAVSRRYAQVPQLVLVFALEKAVYVVSWVLWMQQHSAQLPRLWVESSHTAMFYTTYGVIDLTFGVFFAVVALKYWRTTQAQ